MFWGVGEDVWMGEGEEIGKGGGGVAVVGIDGDVIDSGSCCEKY